MTLAERLSSTLGKLLDNVASILAIVGTFFGAFTAYAAARPNDPIQGLAWAFCGCIGLISLYFLVQHFLIRSLFRSNEERHNKIEFLEKELSETKFKLESISLISNELSGAMVELRKSRSRFDDKLFERPFLGEAPEFEELEEAVKEFFRSLCDTAVLAMAATKKGTEDDFQANIKLLFDNGNNVICHRASVRSTKSSKDRFEYDKLEQCHAVDQNKCMVDTIYRKGRKVCVINGIRKYYNAMRKTHGTLYTYPHDDCFRLYKNLLMVPIKGPVYARSIDNNTIKPVSIISMDGTSECAVGFLTVDSRKFKFDIEVDCGILEEIAAEAYSAYHQYEFFRYMPVENRK